MFIFTKIYVKVNLHRLQAMIVFAAKNSNRLRFTGDDYL